MAPLLECQSPSFSSVDTIINMPVLKKCSKPRVRFGQVEIRKYAIVLGDNPSVTSGPPVGVGWDYEYQSPELLDSFEAKRRGTRRQTTAELALTYQQRLSLCQRAGHSLAEIVDACQQADRVRLQRRLSYAWTEMPIGKACESMELAFGSIKSKIKSRKYRKSGNTLAA